MSRSVVERNGYICDVCGRMHYRRPGNIFKVIYKGKTRHCCGYNCYYKLNSAVESKNYDKADEILAKFANKEEIHEANDPSSI